MNAQPDPKPIKRLAPKNNAQLLEQEITRFTGKGWLIVNRTDTAVQLRKPKQWSVLLLILGAIFLLLFGVGLIFLILAVIDYALKSDRVIYLTIDNIQAGNVPSPDNPPTAFLFIGLALVLVVSMFACLVLWFALT